MCWGIFFFFRLLEKKRQRNFLLFLRNFEQKQPNLKENFLLGLVEKQSRWPFFHLGGFSQSFGFGKGGVNVIFKGGGELFFPKAMFGVLWLFFKKKKKT